MKIHIASRKQLNAFRRECRRNYPLETMAVLHGKRTVEGVEITAINSVPHKATVSSADPGKKTIRSSKIGAIEKGEDWLGTIHSHCNSSEHDACAHPSASDHKSALESGEAIFGIVYVFEGGSRSEVSWHVPVAPPTVIFKEEE